MWLNFAKATNWGAMIGMSMGYGDVHIKNLCYHSKWALFSDSGIPLYNLMIMIWSPRQNRSKTEFAMGMAFAGGRNKPSNN